MTRGWRWRLQNSFSFELRWQTLVTFVWLSRVLGAINRLCLVACLQEEGKGEVMKVKMKREGAVRRWRKWRCRRSWRTKRMRGRKITTKEMVTDGEGHVFSSYLHRILGCRRHWPLDLTSSLKQEKWGQRCCLLPLLCSNFSPFSYAFRCESNGIYMTFRKMSFRWRLSYPRFGFYICFKDCYTTCLSLLSTQTMPLCTRLCWFAGGRVSVILLF